MQVLIGVTGASGAAYAKRLLEELKPAKLVISEVGKQIAEHEVGGLRAPDFENSDLSAPPASGSACYDAMVVVPCSMKTLAAIANGFSDNLICRAADVMLKQGKKLILVVRETPLSLVHIRNMKLAAEAGATILPAMPAFYYRPKTIEDQTSFIVGKILECLGINHTLYEKWQKKKK